MTFEETYLNDNILDALYDMHFETMTPIQEKCIPEILDGNDVLGVAQTGTGKTAAYLLPILSMLDDGGFPEDAINCVVMSPTRELAQQIDQAMEGFSYYLDGISSIAVYGGNDGIRFDQEMKGLRGGAPVVIATPGRLLSHLKMGNLDLSRTSFFVLDEADRMLDMGFSEDILAINKLLPSTCQKIMFSATMPDKIRELAVSLLHNPVEVKIAVSKPAEKIQQSAYICYEPQKVGIIEHLFKNDDLKRVIIFCGKKDRVKDINRALRKLNINCAPMHSDLTQAERDEVMYKFKAGHIDVLVATDIVSRGIDIDDIQIVINFDVPRDSEDYVHRIGRTARADRDGRAITFVSERDMTYFQQIESFLEKTIEKTPLPEGLGEGPEYKAAPKKASAKKHRRNSKGRSQRGRDKRGNGRKSRPQCSEGRREETQNACQKPPDSRSRNPVGGRCVLRNLVYPGCRLRGKDRQHFP
jgi:superfamily II DNA/RNA helicase